MRSRRASTPSEEIKVINSPNKIEWPCDTDGIGWFIPMKHRTFFADTVDVRRPVTHVAAVVYARVVPPDVIAHDDEDVRLFRLRECRAVKKCAEREAEQQR
jgi:hypothetical protein